MNEYRRQVEAERELLKIRDEIEQQRLQSTSPRRRFFRFRKANTLAKLPVELYSEADWRGFNESGVVPIALRAPFKENDFSALRSFASNLRSVVATLQLEEYGMELHSNSTLKQLIDKLPPYFRSRWGERSWAMQPNIPNVADLDAWLDDVAKAEYCIR